MGRPPTKMDGRFGRLLVIARSGSNKRGAAQWLCACDCGNQATVTGVDLRRGATQSCGCLNREIVSKLSGARALPHFLGMKRRIASGYRTGAKMRNLGFELTTEEAAELLVKPCVYCGVEWSLERNGFRHNGIDRVDSTLGYTTKNCVPCCDKCNRAKRDWTVEEFKAWINRVYSHLQGEGTWII